MGRHATNERRRGIAPWAVMAVVAVLLVGAAVVTFVLISGKRSVAGECTGTVNLQVVASPLAADAVRAAAAEFDAGKPVARSKCVSTSVAGRPGGQTLAALKTGWQQQQDPAPALWVADSAADLAALDAADSSLTAGRSTTPIASSPVVLVTRDRASQLDTPAWKDLPALTAASSFRLVLPDPATDAAAQDAVLSALGSSGSVAPEQSWEPVLRNLIQTDPTRPADAAAALTALAGANAPYDLTTAFESQVAAANKAGSNQAGSDRTGTDQPGSTVPGASTGAALTAVYPSGPTAQAQVLTAVLKGSWVDPAAGAAAALFDSFLSGPDGKRILANHGFRVPGTAATTALAGVELSHSVTALKEPGPAVRAALVKAMAGTSSGDPSTGPSQTPTGGPSTASAESVTQVSTAVTAGTTPSTTSTPVSATKPTTSSQPVPTTKTTAPSTPAPPAGPVVTVVADTSSAMDQVVGGKNRNEWLQLALQGLAAKSPTADLGLWGVSSAGNDVGYQRLVPTGPLTGKVGAQTRAQAWAAAVSALKPAGDSWMYGAIQTSYAEAAGQAVPRRSNVMIVVVAGSDRTPALSRADLLASVSGAAGKGVKLQILGLSGDVNAEAMTQIAQAGGGSYQQITADQLPATLLSLAK